MNTIKNTPKDCKVCINGDNNTVIFLSAAHFKGIIHIGTADTKSFNCTVTIGKGTTSNGTTMRILESGTRVRIGTDCMLSDEINIWASDTHTLIDAKGDIINWGRHITIGNHVWIGKHATILKNTTIADGSVVGWGAVVSGTFNMPGSVIAGNPAKVVKTVSGWSSDRPETYLKKGHKISR